MIPMIKYHRILSEMEPDKLLFYALQELKYLNYIGI